MVAVEFEMNEQGEAYEIVGVHLKTTDKIAEKLCRTIQAIYTQLQGKNKGVGIPIIFGV